MNGRPESSSMSRAILFLLHSGCPRMAPFAPHEPPSVAGDDESAMNPGPPDARSPVLVGPSPRPAPPPTSVGGLRIFGAAKKPIHDRHASLTRRADNAFKLPGEAGDPPPPAQQAGGASVSRRGSGLAARGTTGG